MSFERGFNVSRKKAKKGIKYLRSCFNCNYFYKAVGDEDEVCQNPNVSEYDLVVDNNRVYCTYWSPIKEEKDSLFIGTGRNRKL